ncbi:MAG TPA: GTP-binding protein [Solirubrobacteraceae bacterium]|jgi:bifunctional enzyme CysN/CysC|nr:GTP-binding protein [Solirubrobacteraceae bacterium]
MTLDLLRFTTAGSVDDGKSTLIGRMLYDSKQVFADQLSHVEDASRRRGGDGTLDLALLTDGLRAEREQGITIDVAYRYFATPKRRFIIADCPGHQQYTRNMVTGASTADLAIILLDARKGTVEQSKRHAFISALLGIPHLVVAVNKMDLVDYSADRFAELVDEFAGFAAKLDVGDLTYIPISALNGDNVVDRSERLDWHTGPTLLDHLEQVEVSYDHPHDVPARFPVQWVIKPAVGDYRGYAGQLASGAVRPGDEVIVLPGGRRTRIAGIDTFDGELDEAVAPLSITLRLEDDIDVARGELICHPQDAPTVARELEADLCWMDETPLRAGGRYAIKHTSRTAAVRVESVDDRIDVHTLEREAGPTELGLNDIGRVTLRTSAPLTVDPYRANRRTGSFILIDEATNATVAAGMLAGAA